MTDLRDRVADKVRTAMVEAWGDATEYATLPAVAASHLLPVIAAHEAEVVGRILDRIDALHQPVHLVFAWNTGLRRLEPCPTCGGKAGVHECGCWADEDVQYHCGGCTSPDGRHREPHPCPTRRLTAEIRGEMSHG